MKKEKASIDSEHVDHGRHDSLHMSLHAYMHMLVLLYYTCLLFTAIHVALRIDFGMGMSPLECSRFSSPSFLTASASGVGVRR